jgi:4-amino-4-deoxy-L-arabinose transferase-like glycosyltransferase
VTQTDTSFISGQNPSSAFYSGAARIAWIVLILATLYLCYFHNLGVMGFMGPDEPRYAWIARDMAESGDWVTPRLYGKPWFEKPVLYYWGAAASFKLFGVSEAAARLPSAICALLATISMAWLAWRMYGAETARWLLLLLPTTVGMMGFSHAAATDMPFSGMLTVAMILASVIVGLARDDQSPVIPRTPWFALLAFGFFLGLAVLAKGPAAIILSGSAVLIWAAITKRWRDAFRCLHPVAIFSFCATALPWYLLCARRNPDFFRIFIIEHNFKRFLTPEFQHIQPFWYYLPIVLIAFLPWMLALLFASGVGIFRFTRGGRFSSATTFLLCWAIFCLLFFSVSKSKLPGYILPSIPAIGLLLARSYICLTAGEGKLFRWIQLGTGTLTTALGAILSMTHLRESPGAGKVLIAFGIANLLMGIQRNRSMPAVGISFLCVVPILLVLIFLETLLPHFLVWDPSGKTLAGEIMSKGIPPEQLYVAHMSRGQQFSLNFYLRHETQKWNPAVPKEGYLLLNSERCRDHVPSPFVCQSNRAEPNPSGWFIYQVKLQK